MDFKHQANNYHMRGTLRLADNHRYLNYALDGHDPAKTLGDLEGTFQMEGKHIPLTLSNPILPHADLNGQTSFSLRGIFNHGRVSMLQTDFKVHHLKFKCLRMLRLLLI